ncbi:MAG: ExeA family protein [Eubacteriales bacterium]
MIREYFGLTQMPFSKEIATDRLFKSKQHQELVARLLFIINSRYFGLVTGDIGAGKSTAIRSVYDRLDQSKYKFVYLADSSLNSRSFYRDILFQLGVTPGFHASDAKRQFKAAVMDYYTSQARLPVVVIDEAHLLSPEMLQEIRFLHNFKVDSVSPLALILCGQPELRGLLRMRVNDAITQRINVRFHLSGLSDQETREYIDHNMRIAGAKAPIFSDQAVASIYAHTRGIPRAINNLCTACLLDITAHDQRIIDENTVLKVVGEFEQV